VERQQHSTYNLLFIFKQKDGGSGDILTPANLKTICEIEGKLVNTAGCETFDRILNPGNEGVSRSVMVLSTDSRNIFWVLLFTTKSSQDIVESTNRQNIILVKYCRKSDH